MSGECSATDEEAIVPVISVPQGFNEDELYVDLRSIFGHSLFLSVRASTSPARSS